MKKYIFLSTILLLAGLLNSCEKFALEPAADTFLHVKIAGTELPVWIKGNTASKKMILYINGGPGLTSIDVARADLFNWSEGLEENFAMVYYDQRGCGNAQGNLEESTLTIEQYIKDLQAIITLLKAKYDDPKIYLMGHSFGAFIGANYLLTEDFQRNITGWISIDGAYNFDFDLSWQYRRTFLINIAHEEIAKGERVDHWTGALAWAEANPVVESRMQKDELLGFIGLPGEIIIPEEMASISVRQYLGIGFGSSYNVFPAYLSSNLEIVNDALNGDVEGINLIPEIGAITLPTLMLWGRYDDLIAPEEGMAVFDNLGTADADKYFKLLPNSSHEPYISDPEAFKREIIDFVLHY